MKRVKHFCQLKVLAILHTSFQPFRNHPPGSLISPQRHIHLPRHFTDFMQFSEGFCFLQRR